MRIPVQKIRATVGQAFDGLGRDFTIRRVVSEGVFDPVTGQQTSRVVSDRVMRGVDAGVEQQWMAGSAVLVGEYVIYLFDDGQGTPSNKDFVLFDGREVAIQSVSEYSVAGTNIAYRLAVAK